MHRPASGPLWPPTDDTVENSLRRAYLRAPSRIPADTALPDRFRDLLDDLADALNRPEFRPNPGTSPAFRHSA